MKFALIGNGFIGSKHIEAINKVGAELACVCDIDESRAVPGVEFFTNYLDAFDGVDAVSICTPNYLHVEMIHAAAKRNLKILSEKTMTFNLDEVESLKKVPHLFGMFQLRYLPEISVMKRVALPGSLVNLVVEMKRSSKYYDSWKGDPTKTGGLLINIGCHYFDLVGQLFGYDKFSSIMHEYTETRSLGTFLYVDGTVVNWRIELTDEKPSYERSLTINDQKFDLVQRENLHIRIYEQFKNGNGIRVDEEEKILRMIYSIK